MDHSYNVQSEWVIQKEKCIFKILSLLCLDGMKVNAKRFHNDALHIHWNLILFCWKCLTVIIANTLIFVRSFVKRFAITQADRCLDVCLSIL